jgi:hypothetical protein
LNRLADLPARQRPRYADFPAYILGVTEEIWEGRGVAVLERAYAPGIVVRSAGGLSVGNATVIDDTLAKMAAFPDLQIFGDDVIWCAGEAGHLLSSHRSTITGTHTGHGYFGPPTGRRYAVRCIADCAARGEVIDDEWLVYDNGGIVRQLGHAPAAFAAMVIAREGGPAKARRPFTPDQDRRSPYTGRGNDNEWGARLAGILARIMDKDIAVIRAEYDRAIYAEYAGGRAGWSREFAETFWMQLRAAFPTATFAIHHVIGRSDPHRPHRAAVRWSLDGRHDGFGAFGAPTGAAVHIMGMTHAEWGPWGLRREVTLYDEVAIWKQILLQTGEN